MRTLLISLALILGLAACVGVEVQTPRQGVAVCYKTVEVALNTATDLRVRGKLTDQQRTNILAISDQALLSCDAARAAIGAGDLTTAEGKLKAAESVLLQLETWTKSQGGK